MRVRGAQQTDLRDLRRQHRELYGYHHANFPSIFKKVPEEGDDGSVEFVLERSLVCCHDEAVVGFLHYGFQEIKESDNLNRRSLLVVYDLIVAEEYRQKGVGSLLLEEAEDVAKKEGCDSIEVPVFSFNTGALSFYERRGYGEYVRRLRKVL